MPETQSAKPLIKICGITRAEDLLTSHDCGVDFVGFNFYPGSKRHINPRAAFQIWSEFSMARPGHKMKPVAVVVDESQSALQEMLGAFPGLHALQLHGSETGAFIADCRKNFPVEIWKAVPVAVASDSVRVEEMRNGADLVLLDSAAVPQGAKVPGGSGKTIDWQLFSQLIGSPGIGVAGGLTPDNISALLLYKPYMVDTASGVETVPGIKSREKIESFVKACRAQDRS